MQSSERGRCLLLLALRSLLSRLVVFWLSCSWLMWPLFGARSFFETKGCSVEEEKEKEKKRSKSSVLSESPPYPRDRSCLRTGVVLHALTWRWCTSLYSTLLYGVQDCSTRDLTALETIVAAWCMAGPNINMVESRKKKDFDHSCTTKTLCREINTMLASRQLRTYKGIS
jgi:hypothetical protein